MKKIYLITAIIIVISVVAFFKLQKNTTPAVLGELKQDEKGNFVLHVSNQSFDVDPVDIKIFIDGNVAVDDDFFVETQHTYVSYRFSLSNGVHKLKIESKKGEATFESNINIVDKHSGIVEYWYYPEKGSNPPTQKHFTFSFGEDKPLEID